MPQEPLPAEDRKLALLAALLLPLRAAMAPAGGGKKHKAASGSAARHIVRCGALAVFLCKAFTLTQLCMSAMCWVPGLLA